MNNRPASDLDLSELSACLRAGAAGSYTREAATELLIRHGTWLTAPAFVDRCLHHSPDAPAGLAVDWPAVVDVVLAGTSNPADSAIALIAAQIGWTRDPESPDANLDSLPPLSWLLSNLTRHYVDLVLAALAHATGTHDQVEHLGTPDGDGTWRITTNSPRVRLGSLHPWPGDQE